MPAIQELVRMISAKLDKPYQVFLAALAVHSQDVVPA